MNGPAWAVTFWCADAALVGMRIMPFAIVQTGGKQHRVEPGQVIEVEKLPAGEGETVELTDVRLVSTENGLQHGTPRVDGARVVATVLKQGRGRKIIVFKYKAKVRYRRKAGHRQSITRLAIQDIITS
jgi:large subunit ribosomal protein L21